MQDKRDKVRMAVLPMARLAPTTAAGRDPEVERLKRRESEAWAEVFERDHGVVFRAVLAQVGDRQVAEDIAAQVFLEAMEGIARYADRGRPFTAWLLAIARHRTLDWHRKRRREGGGPVPDAKAPGPEAELTVALEALALLTPEQREVVHLRFVEGYQFDEVGKLLGRSTGSVKALQHRALARLRVILCDPPGGET